MQSVVYAPISDINFTAPTTKRKRALEGESGQQSQLEFVVPTPPSRESFIYELSKTGKPALLSTLPDYCDEYVVDNRILSLPLSAVFCLLLRLQSNA